MGKILFSTCKIDDFFISRTQEQGFNLNKKIGGTEFNVINFYKKIRKIENAFLCGDDFCFSSGTLVYKDKIGEEALSDIFYDFDNDVEKIRKEILGNYCLIICKNNKINIFVDKYDVYKIFYQVKDGVLFLSSDISDVMYRFKNTDISEFNLMLDAFQCAPVGSDTFMKEIKRLLGRQIIEIDIAINNINIKEILYKRKRNEYNNVDAAAETMAKSISDAYKTIEKAYGDDVGINMTGGLDSRVVLGGCLSAGIKPKLLHAQGNSRLITGTEKGDYNCVHKMANTLGLKVFDMCWDCNYPENVTEWNALFDKYSFNNKFYGGNPNFYKAYEELGEDLPLLLETGLFGEIMRIRTQYNLRTKPFDNFHDFMIEYQNGSGNHSGFIINSEFYNNSRSCLEYFEERYKSELKKFSFNPEASISMDDFEEVRYIHARAANAVLINFLNQYTGCISVLSTEQVCEVLCDSKQAYRAFATLQLKIIGKLYQELLIIPFFSHCSDCTYDKKKNKLVTKLSLNEKVGAKLRKIGLKNSILYNGLRTLKYKFLKSDWKIKRTLERKEETDRILPVIINSINKDQQDLGRFVNTNYTPKDDSIVHLMYYAIILRGINTIREHIKNSNK